MKIQDFGEQLESIKRIGKKKDFPKNWGKVIGTVIKTKERQRTKKEYDELLKMAEKEIVEWTKFIILMKKNYKIHDKRTTRR